MQISIDLLGYVGAFCTTVSFLPQALLTIRTKNTEALSLGMYSLFTIGVVFWLLYGFLKKDYALIFGNFITLILALTILSFKIKSIILNRLDDDKTCT